MIEGYVKCPSSFGIFIWISFPKEEGLVETRNGNGNGDEKMENDG